MFAEVDAALSYFEPGIFRWQPPATDAMIANAEQILNVQFPLSVRLFYKRHNGFNSSIDPICLSLPEVGEDPNGVARDHLVSWSLCYREEPDDDMSGEVDEDGKTFVTLLSDFTGDPYCLLPTKIDERGECPIAKVNHETREVSWIVASSFERLLWFYITDLQRYYRPDGEPKDQDEREALDDESVWYEDLDYLLQHDPHLAQWRS